MHDITLKDYTDLGKATTTKKIFWVGNLAKVPFEITVAHKKQ